MVHGRYLYINDITIYNAITFDEITSSNNFFQTAIKHVFHEYVNNLLYSTIVHYTSHNVPMNVVQIYTIPT